MTTQHSSSYEAHDRMLHQATHKCRCKKMVQTCIVCKQRSSGTLSPWIKKISNTVEAFPIYASTYYQPGSTIKIFSTYIHCYRPANWITHILFVSEFTNCLVIKVTFTRLAKSGQRNPNRYVKFCEQCVANHVPTFDSPLLHLHIFARKIH